MAARKRAAAPTELAKARAAKAARGPQVRVLAIQDLDFEEATIFQEETGYGPNDYLKMLRSPGNRLRDFNGNLVYEALPVPPDSVDDEGYGLNPDGERISDPDGYALDQRGQRIPAYKSPPVHAVQVLHYLWMRRNDPENASLEAARQAKPTDMVVDLDDEGDPTKGG